MILRLALFAALVLVAVGYLQRMDSRGGDTVAVSQADAPAAPALPPPAPRGPVVLVADQSGHYRAEGDINGRPVRFIVDTGATVVALNSATAKRLNIAPNQSDYRAKVQTANGTIDAAAVRLDEVRIGNAVVRGVDAVVLPDSALNDNLLGMSFLNRLRGFESKGGRLVLNP